MRGPDELRTGRSFLDRIPGTPSARHGGILGKSGIINMKHVQKSLRGWLKASAVLAGLTLVTAICVTRGVKK